MSEVLRENSNQGVAQDQGALHEATTNPTAKNPASNTAGKVANDVVTSDKQDLEKSVKAEHQAKKKRGKKASVVDVSSQYDVEELPPDTSKYLIEVNNLYKWFPIKGGVFQQVKNYVRAVDSFSCKIKPGSTLGLVGESGCGKTTVGRTMLKLYQPTRGSVYYQGQNIYDMSANQLRKIRPELQMIFQDPYSSLQPRMPVGEIIGEAVREHNIVPKSDYRDYVIETLIRCGLQAHHVDRYPHEFSGGQRQRICIARSLALKPKFIVCDESVSALDVSIQAQIINLLMDLQESEGLTYLFISHDLSVVEHISSEVGVMYLGNLVEMGPKEKIFDEPLHPYTKALFSAIPMPDPDIKMTREILQGDIPSPSNPPSGCKFHTRCPQCMEICKHTVPKMVDFSSGHRVACHLYSGENAIGKDQVLSADQLLYGNQDSKAPLTGAQKVAMRRLEQKAKEQEQK